tara:strand:+ start:588 stop:1268 length:681 start_codon:yes stop_codon:yes gene_type:complete
MNKKIKKLPQAYEEIYEDFYKDYALSKSLFRKFASFLESWYHKEIAKMGIKNCSILEIGCGALNHVPYEKTFSRYDVIEPKNYLIKATDKKRLYSINKIYKSLDHLPCDIKYSKIISIAVLEHIDDLEQHLISIKKLIEPKGVFSVAIPAEGEFLWWISWRLTTGIGFWLKYKLDYGLLMRYEHINQASKIINLIKKYFYIEKINSFPFKIKNLRLYITLECKSIN